MENCRMKIVEEINNGNCPESLKKDLEEFATKFTNYISRESDLLNKIDLLIAKQNLFRLAVEKQEETISQLTAKNKSLGSIVEAFESMVEYHESKFK